MDTFAQWKNLNRLSTREFFTEPFLGFEVHSGNPGGLPATFRIYLGAEFLPPDTAKFGVVNPIPGEGEAWLDFGIDAEKLRKIINDFEKQLARHPVRVELKKTSTDS